eukprot:7702077-Karenia_brevis.AAC.1
MINISKHVHVNDITHDQCPFGAPWRKRTKLRSYKIDLKDIAITCGGRGVCEFSGKPHIALSGTSNGVFRTSLAAAYPKPCCRKAISCIRNSIYKNTGEKLAALLARASVSDVGLVSDNIGANFCKPGKSSALAERCGTCLLTNSQIVNDAEPPMTAKSSHGWHTHTHTCGEGKSEQNIV